MLRKVRWLAPAFPLLIATHLCSQDPPKTPEQVLAQAGISGDKDSLIRALDDNRPGILASAATVLAEWGITEAVPAINSRMKGSQDKPLVLTLAQSLNILGSSDGTKQLEAFCLRKDVESGERMRAAYALVYTNNYSCLPIMPEYLDSSHADEEQSALLYLLHIPSPQKNAPKTLGPALLAIATGDIGEQFRTLARKIIEQIGDPATKHALMKRGD
jgi:HEAT repeat protein